MGRGLWRNTGGVLTQPRINTREADTRVLMKDKETLVIGGLLQDEDARKYWSLPGIDRVPLIGRLFTRKQTSVDQKNLLIFITPSICDVQEKPAPRGGWLMRP